MACVLKMRISNAQFTGQLGFFHRTIPELSMKLEFWRSHLGKNPRTKRYGGHCFWLSQQ